MSNNWSEMTFSKKEPTDIELQEIEKDLTSINLDEEFLLKTMTLTESELEERMKVFSKKELIMIDEMIKIIEDPNYISSARKRRLENQSDIEDDIESISFDGNIMLGGIYNLDDENYY